MYARLRLVILVVFALVNTSPGSAQQANVRLVPAAAGPRLDAVVTGMQRADLQNDLAATSLQRRSQTERQSVALMIVGGAAVVLGAFIGDDVGTLFMIGGAVAILIGLYRYLS